MGVQEVLHAPEGLDLHQAYVEMFRGENPPNLPVQALWELEGYETFSPWFFAWSSAPRAPTSALEL